MGGGLWDTTVLPVENIPDTTRTVARSARFPNVSVYTYALINNTEIFSREAKSVIIWEVILDYRLKWNKDTV